MSDSTQDLVRKLRQLRDDTMRLPWPERRDALRRVLDQELAKLPRDRAKEVLAAVRGELIGGNGASAAGAGTTELRAEIEAARADRDRMRADRDRARADADARIADAEARVEALEAEKARLERDLEEARAAPSAAPAVSAGGGGDLEGFRVGLLKSLKSGKVNPDAFGVHGVDARLFEALVAVVNFAMNYDLGVSNLVLDISGRMDSQGTTMGLFNQQAFRKRFEQAIERGDEGLANLKKLLQKDLKFLLALNLAYLNCLRDGTHRLLGDIDPMELRGDHKKFMGTDFEGAFNSFQRKHGDLMNLLKGELWEIYFSHRVREELKEYLD